MAYEFWKAAIEGKNPELSADDPQEGFYRIRRGKAWIPVAIWWHGERDENDEFTEDAKLVCVIGFSDTAQVCDPLDIWDPKSSLPMSIWQAAAKSPVEEIPYRTAYDTGRWHDDAPEAPRGIGDNLPEEPVEQIKIELQGEAEIVDKFLATPITTQKQADTVGPWVDRLRKTAQRADKKREEEKRPYLEAGRQVDDKWRFVIAKATELTNKLKKHLKRFLDEQDLAARERARAAAAEAERLRKEAEKQKGQAEREELERKAAEAAKHAVVENVSAGRTGEKVSLRREKHAEITDYDVLLTALKDRNEVKDVVDTLAQRAARAGIELPGMKIVEITKAV
jgi:hypothetical protein